MCVYVCVYAQKQGIYHFAQTEQRGEWDKGGGKGGSLAGSPRGTSAPTARLLSSATESLLPSSASALRTRGDSHILPWGKGLSL